MNYKFKISNNFFYKNNLLNIFFSIKFLLNLIIEISLCIFKLSYPLKILKCMLNTVHHIADNYNNIEVIVKNGNVSIFNPHHISLDPNVL
jgi:hypothetical protein